MRAVKADQAVDHKTLFKDTVTLDGFTIDPVRAVLNLGTCGEAVEDAHSDTLVELLR